MIPTAPLSQETLISHWVNDFASAHHLTKRKHLAIEYEIFNLLDMCAVVPPHKPGYLRHQAVKVFLGRLIERRRARVVAKDKWRVDFLEWAASQPSFLHHASL